MLQIIPKGSKGIIIKKEFNDEIKTKVEEITNELKPLETMEIKSQDDVVKINASLKKAKKLKTTLTSERKGMSGVLDEEKDELISLENTVGDPLDKSITIINTRVTVFQTAEAEKIRLQNEAIARKKQEELDELNRKNKIQSTMVELEKNILSAIQSSTIDDIDIKITKILTLSLKKEVYQEFLSDAQKIVDIGVLKFKERKQELLKLQQLEKENKQQAEQLREQQAAKAKEEKETFEAKAINQQEENINSISNIQMESELKSAQVTKLKNVQMRWGYDENMVNMELLPDEYKTFDAKKISEAIAEGARDIPGIRIYQKVINTSR